MRFGRARVAGQDHWVAWEGDRVVLLDAPPWEPHHRRGEVSAGDASPLAPVLPSKIVCIGSNYRAHAEEMGKPVPAEPLLFLKPPSALLDPGAAIVLPPASSRVDYEGELGVVIGRRLKDVRPEDAAAGIFGFTCVNDVTARDLQRRDVQFTRGKGFDTFCPCGPWIETELDPRDLEVATRLDGELVQRGRTTDMVFPVADLLSFISGVMTLLPGDLISTGTPAGVGPLRAGRRVEVAVEGVGILFNPVVA